MLVFRRVWTRLVLAGALVAPLPSTVGAQSLPESAAAGTRRAAADTQDPAQAIKGEIDELKKDFNARLAALESRLADPSRRGGGTGRRSGSRWTRRIAPCLRGGDGRLEDLQPGHCGPRQFSRSRRE